jgi:hypothetical protein
LRLEDCSQKTDGKVLMEGKLSPWALTVRTNEIEGWKMTICYFCISDYRGGPKSKANALIWEIQ